MSMQSEGAADQDDLMMMPRTPIVPGDIEQAVRSLRSGDSAQAGRAAEVLYAHWTSDLVEPVIEVLECPNWFSRFNAVRLLEADPAAAPHLHRIALHDPDLRVRLTAYASLDPKHPDAGPVLVQGLRDQSPDVQSLCLGLVALREDGSLVSGVEDLLRSPDWELRWAACQTMYRLGVRTAHLLTVLQTLHREPGARQQEHRLQQVREDEAHLRMGYEESGECLYEDPQWEEPAISELLASLRDELELTGGKAQASTDTSTHNIACPDESDPAQACLQSGKTR